MGEHDTKKMCPRCGSYDHHTADKCNRPEIDGGGGPDDIEDPVKSYNTSKSNTTEVDGDGGGPDDIEDPVKSYNTSKSNTTEVDVDGGGGPDDIDIEKSPVEIHSFDVIMNPADSAKEQLAGLAGREVISERISQLDQVSSGGGPDDIDVPDSEVAAPQTYIKNKDFKTDVDGGGGPDDIDIENPMNKADLAVKKNIMLWDGTSVKPGEGGGGNGGNGVEKGFKGGATSADATVSERTGVDHGGGNGGNGVEKGFKGGATGADATVSEHTRTGVDHGGGNGGGVDGEKADEARRMAEAKKRADEARRMAEANKAREKSAKEAKRMAEANKAREKSAKEAKRMAEAKKRLRMESLVLDTDKASVKKGPGIVRKGVGKTLGLAKTMIMTAVLISIAGAGVDVYQTYNDAMEIDLEKHITDADFEMSDDKSEISGTVGFDIPEMGTFEKSIIASVHVTVLESNPTTDGDYEFEYKLGSGEQFYDFTLDDLDPVTVEKIEAGQPLDIEYSGTISVTYFGIEIPSVTMDIPLTTTTVETA